ncbi:MAG TPA: NAD-dependent epimerase/dehydratase family protein [Burkholderiales bacterium]|nr:NAD-dependent epimerase/dehydratase family protein [Burkholderiales bacterium]
MRILVTGAAGYIGSALVKALAGREVLATDQSAPAPVIGNLAYPQFARSLVTRDIEAVFHLASLVSGGAEQSFELGTKVNLDATRDLLEACRLAGHCPKFIFASSVAVYGGVSEVNDETPPAPRLSYGAQKLVCEILIDDYTRRGYIDGRALRLPAVLVRPGGPNTAVSGWSSAIIREPLAGRDYACPVSPDTRLACISLAKVVQGFLHAEKIAADRLGERRTVLLNGIGASAREMWDAVRPRASGNVRFVPDPAIQSVMDGAPRSTFSKRSLELGFPASASIQEIIREYEEAALAHHG